MHPSSTEARNRRGSSLSGCSSTPAGILESTRKLAVRGALALPAASTARKLTAWMPSRLKFRRAVPPRVRTGASESAWYST